eukprot:1957299-Amphidinium_carterae.1
MRRALSAFEGDMTFVCAVVATGLSNSAKASTFFYQFDVRPSCPPPLWQVPGAYHALELPYVFGNSPHIQSGLGCRFDAAQQDLHENMQVRWINFVKTLSPDGPDQS